MDVPEPISRRSALAVGYTDHELKGHAWQRVRRGHYVDSAAAAPLTPAQRHLVAIRAVISTASPEAVVSHVSAAIVHDIPIWATPLTRVHVLRDRRTGGRIHRHLAVHTARLLPGDHTEVDGIRVTTAPRTVIDLARTLPFEQAVVIGDAALRSGKTTGAELLDQLIRVTGRKGCPAARRVVDFLDGRSESVGESRSRVQLLRSGLSAPELQAIIFADTGTRTIRVDYLWPDLALVGEFDGMIKYHKEIRGDRTPEEVVIAEKLREDALRALGLRVIRWTWSDLDTPTTWFARLHAAATHPHDPLAPTLWRPTPRI
ncbi:hypothetical protein OHB26_20475 [Nocardia sp. NBC_01503]|uniref:hypothetical protein n=1 Tax=Nocardia sp. NBC_01503 TaxID=2975997 RepID=UPI002E7B3AFB|nr:hypothetical protein [Nocardia sp. NBC_01503]WTL29382.1 hypothetical protein OHB26_20475 [Nocardia sp. NBC_01503]